jgi:hypothetical protein
MSRSSISDTPDYRTVCKSAAEDEALFASFKRNPTYNVVLEHTDPKYVPELCKAILDNGLDLSKLDVLKTNDEQGGAILVDAGSPFGQLSPSTLRYVKVLSDIQKMFGSQTDKVVVEVGIGYGGQCKILSDFYKLSQYHLVDIREPLALAKRYLQKYGYGNIKYFSFDDEVEAMDSYDLFISNYAFSEFARELQQFYIENFILKSKHGYMTCNFVSDAWMVDSMSKQELLAAIPNCKEAPERPQTHEHNRILYW